MLPEPLQSRGDRCGTAVECLLFDLYDYIMIRKGKDAGKTESQGYGCMREGMEDYEKHGEIDRKHMSGGSFGSGTDGMRR